MTTNTSARTGALDAFLFAGLAALLSLLVFFPGFMSDDSFVQLRQARAGLYTNVQPPLMSIIWRGLDRVMTGSTGLLILQNYLYWAGLALVFLPFRRRWFYFSLVVAVGVFPPYFLLQGAIWKDNLMGGFMLCSLGFYVLAVLERGSAEDPRRLKRMLCLSASVACAFLALMMRHNAIFGVFPLLYLVASEAMGGRSDRVLAVKPVLASVAATFVAFFLAATLTNALAVRHVRLSQLVAVFDLVAIGAKTGDPVFDEAKYPALKHGFTGAYHDAAAVRKAYIPCDAFPVFVSHSWGTALWTLTDDSAAADQAWSAWREAAAKHPGVLAAHKLEVFACSLGIGEMGPWYAPIYWERPERPELGIHTGDLSEFQLSLVEASQDLSKTPAYAVWIYFALALAVWLLSLFGRKPLDRLAFCVASSGLLYQSAFLLVGITTEFRYYIWLIICSVVAAATYALPRLGKQGPVADAAKSNQTA